MAREKPPVRRRPDIRHKETILKVKERVGWWFMLPFGVLSVFAFVELFLKASIHGSLLSSSECLCFLLGAGVWVTVFAWLRAKFAILYVFAHEMTHIISALLCGAVIYDWHVGSNGGWVDTNKSNTFISLSPYVVPFYTIIVLLGFGIAGLFTDFSHWHSVHLGSVEIPLNSSKILHYLVGLTWAFHLSFTLAVMRDEQGDLVRNGQFFSVWLIALMNLYLIICFLIIASPNLFWSDVWGCFGDLVTGVFGGLYYGFAWVGNQAWAEGQDMLNLARHWHGPSTPAIP
ncbi:MAG: hypothetical protein JWO94_1819 [Verrucomicrobiaceae bacterium]|nr:hypothetical protein [Verrucomicrobiaceae bacterium]